MKRTLIKVTAVCMILAGIAACVIAGIQHRINLRLEREAYEFVTDVLPALEEATEEGEGSVDGEPIVYINGIGYLGVLRFPTLDDLTLPVIAGYTEENLKLAPCRYLGTVAGNDIIIAGHNYRKQFSPVRSIQTGAEVIFTDAAGRVYTYEVSLVEVVDGMAVEDMVSGEWDMSLFTCTLNHVGRVTVRCVRTEEETERRTTE